jgi:ABC-2 type transport system ATP-binding protein
MWDMVRGLVADGVTIFLTTLYLDEADHLADRIAVLDHGRLVAYGTPGDLKHQVPGSHVRLRSAAAADAAVAGNKIDRMATAATVIVRTERLCDMGRILPKEPGGRPW